MKFCYGNLDRTRPKPFPRALLLLITWNFQFNDRNLASIFFWQTHGDFIHNKVDSYIQIFWIM